MGQGKLSIGDFMKLIMTMILAVLVATSYGCTTKLYVTYNSDPPGATLYQGGQSMGFCPTMLTYNVQYKDRMQGHKILQGTEAKWVSGATAKIDQLTANLTTIGKYQQFTFMRPTGLDGAETDAKFGLEVLKLKTMQQQVQAQQDANILQMYNIISTQNKSSTVNLKANCSSRAIGSTVYTDCN
jgi:hypothetical protein